MTSNSTQEKRLTIDSRIEELQAVERFVDELHEEHNFKADVYGNILVAVTEAVNNAILHGNDGDVNKKVELTARLKSTYVLQIEVKDQGTGFNYQSVKDPTAPENLLNEHGRGVFVMEHLADTISFVDPGNIVQMEFNI